MKRTITSRVISILLISAMLFTMTGVGVFAEGEGGESEEEKTKNLLVFGASTSSGYGLSDFYNSNRGYAANNNDLYDWTYEKAKASDKGGDDVGRMSEESYPWKLKKYIAEKEFGFDPNASREDPENNAKLNKVYLSPLCLNGMRTNELHGLLDPEYAQAAFDRENEIVGKDNLGFYVEHLQSIIACLGSGGAKVDMEDGKGMVPVWNSGEARDPSSEAYRRAHKFVVDEVKKADVVVVDVCMNNFGTYLACRLSGKYGISGYENRSNLYKETPETIIGASPEVVKMASDLKATMQKMIPMLKDNENIDFIIDSFIYCLIDAMTNLSADVQLIKEINPDAKIITVGVYNTLDGITTEVNGEDYDFGAITSKGFELFNLYIKGLDKNSNYYYYADVQDNVETFMNQIVETDKSYEDFIKDPDNDSLLEKIYHGSDSFYDLFLKGMESDPKTAETNPDSVLNTLRDPSKRLLFKAAKRTHLHMDELMGNLSNLFAIGNEMTAYFNAVGAYSQIPEPFMYPFPPEAPMVQYESLTDTQKVAILARFVDQVLGGQADTQTAMVTAIVGYLTDSYVWSSEDNKALAKSAAYTVATETYGVSEHDAAVGIDADPEHTEDITPCPKDSTMELMQILDRFIVYMGIGQHPSKKGCETMFQDVKTAYDKSQTNGNTAAADLVQEILEEIEKLREKIQDIDGKIDSGIVKELIEELGPIYDEAMKIGKAILDLPKSTELINSYAELLNELKSSTDKIEDRVTALEISSEEMKNQISDLEQQLGEYREEEGLDLNVIAKLAAKAIKADIETKVTFPAGKVKIAVSWDKDNDAAGYTFKVNGVVTEPTATETGFIYEDNAANVGESYSFEVRPYILFKGVKIEGSNYKATVVPKVNISKGAITSLKKGTKSFKVKWKAVSGASGYQVSYKVGKKTSKKTVIGGKKISLKVTGLKSGKKYTVKVRAWKTVNGKKYYGKWSNAKKVTVK